SCLEYGHSCWGAH
uniref:Neuropeptide CCHamide-1 n=2 Tax=Schizophora TaxID=43738 RepID=CCHA1_DELRA|nr:RecName: Full=Neuropeptide CCHamide-1 [Delia radicum]